MPKYIELEKAINLFYPVDPENDGSDGCTTVLKSEKYSSEEIESMLSDLPVADVTPVIHAKWERLNNTQKHYCPECGMDFDLYACIRKLFNYCPYCGAKMDLKEDK